MVKKHIKKLLSIPVVLVLSISFSTFIYAKEERTWQRIDIDKKASLRGSAIEQKSLWVSGSDNTVFVSHDMGKTWADRSIKSTIKTDFRDIALFDKNTAIVMGAGEGEQSVLYKTTDAGRNWQLLTLNKDAKGFYDSIAFWDEQHGLLLGDPVDGYYVVKKTIDGGKTWQRIAQVNLPVILKNEAAFAASGNTIITGENGQAWITTGGFSASVYYSGDFGKSWQRQAIPLFNKTQTAGGYGLALNSQQTVFVLGGDYQQREAKYVNIVNFMDDTWQRVDAKKRGLRTAMACIDAVCIATGKTSSDISYDHGFSWQAFDDLTAQKNNRGFYTLAASEKVILAAGTNGKVAIYHAK